jgi:hypothetical protein
LFQFFSEFFWLTAFAPILDPPPTPAHGNFYADHVPRRLFWLRFALIT